MLKKVSARTIIDLPSTPKASADGGGSQDGIGVEGESYSASTSLKDNPPEFAFDGDLETVWSAGSGPEQWLQVDFASPRRISNIQLVISQYPAGETRHQILVGSDTGIFTIAHEFTGFTEDPQTLDFSPVTPLENIRSIRIITTSSPSWVAWREIIIN